MLTALCQATILTGEAAIEGHALVLDGDTIVDIVRDGKQPPEARQIAYPDRLLVPGFIDAQVNGGDNLLFNQQPDVATALAIAQAHRRHGTTRLLLTCITDHVEILPQALSAMRQARVQTQSILGLHIEGPYLAQPKRGIHDARYLRPMIPNDLQMYHRQGDETLLITVAAETVSPEQIKQLCQQELIVSIGHTAATAEQTRAALQAGATGFTHLYNGMTGLSARDPGVAGVALDDANSWCGLIVDQHHVSAEMVRLAVRAKPGKIFLVSDAMPPAASDMPQPYQLYDKLIRLESGRCVDDEGRLAGAALTMAEAVRNCVTIGIDAEEALRMAATYPAAFLGQTRLGKLLPGFLADITVLDHQLRVETSWLGGMLIDFTNSSV